MIEGRLQGNRRLSALRGWCCAAFLLAGPTLFAQSPPPNSSAPTDVELSEPERIARLQRAADEAAAQLAKIQAAMNDPAGEFAAAEREFIALDDQLCIQLREVEKLKASGNEAEADARGPELDALRKRWALARERFQIAIEERRTQSEQAAALETKLASDRGELATIQAATTRPSVNPAEPPAQTPAPAAPPAVAPAQPSTSQPAAVLLPQNSASPSAAQSPAADADPEEVRRAKEKLAARQDEAAKATEAAQTLSQRIETVRKSIELGQKLQESAQKKAANARETQRTLNEDVQRRWADGAPKAELDELWAKIADARKRYQDAEADVASGVDRLDGLQGELERLQAQHIAALQDAARKQSEAAAAQKLVAELSDPWHPQNVARWLRDRGLRIAGIALAMALLLWVVRRTQRYMIRIMSRGRGSHEELENRAKTLVGVFNNAATIAILVGGALMVLTELGMSVGPLLGGAAVIGLAVGLGAQNLIRDFFSGFMILLENQYGINDVVKINNLSGLVENITLRITVLRDIDGTVHFIPNGQINAVSNMTHGWSRAVFDIGVSYESDVDRAMNVLVDIGRALRREPAYRDIILEDPEMLGVESLAESSVVIRFVMRTRPLKQWMVKREMLRRIKKRFDEEGIVIPYPHRTVYHKHETAETIADAAKPAAPERRERFIGSPD
ncbi:MAG: mechanosensitive ion channel [Phycisphaerales bacterium]|nr:mechanosensitive ion channel [Phycisphaerales bacterium]